MIYIVQDKPFFALFLDCSAAFDIDEHKAPFSRLKDVFGLFR